MLSRARFRCLAAATPAAIVGVLRLVAATPVWAGPPYLSDDPQPTDPSHWETYTFVSGVRGPSGLGGEAGLDINYGEARDLQLTAVLPLAFDDASGFASHGLHTGVGDVELAVKHLFLHQADGGAAPDVSVFPRLFVPTGGRRFGSDHLGLLLPVWAEKDAGAWSVFGGGGYEINPGSGLRNFWQGGAAVTRNVTRRLQLGVEGYAQGDDATKGGGYATVNFGLTYKLVKHWSLLASAGPTWLSRGDHGHVFYVSLKADY